MQQHLIELSVGETLQVGQYTVTLLDIDGDALSIEIEGFDDHGDRAEMDSDSDVLETV